MTRPPAIYLLDTSAYINSLTAPLSGPFRLPPGAATAVSVITEIELRYGVAAAPGDQLRLGQLTLLLSRWRPRPVDAAVTAAYSPVVAAAISAGQQPRRRMNDLMIAATALAHDMTLVTDDHDLADVVSGLLPVQPLS